MTTTSKPIVVNFHRVWTRLPSVGDMPSQPATPVQKEDYRIDYTEDQLRTMVIENVGMIGDMVVDTASVAALPENYLSELYANTRFSMPISGELMPIRLGDAFTTSPYSLPNYFLMSALLHAIYQKELLTTDPESKWKLDNGLRLLKQINYMMLRVLQTNPAGVRPPQPVVSAYTEVYSTEVIQETTHVVLIDSYELAALEQTGWTAQSIADHWTATKTQPS